MRILDLNNWYSPRGGGIRIYHERKLAWYAGQAGHAYGLLVPDAREAAERAGPVTRYLAPALPLPGTPYRFVVRAAPLARILDDFRPDLVEVGSAYVLPVLVRRLLRTRRIATVGFYHSDYPDTVVGPATGPLGSRLQGWLTGLARRHVRRVYGAFTATFGASDFVLEKLHGLGIRRLFRTPLGVDLDEFQPARRSARIRESLGVGRGQRLLLYLGRLSPEKGLDLLLRAYPGLRDPQRRVLAIAGHGPREGRLRGFLARYPEVRRIGYLRGRREVADLMASADACLVLGPHETFSLTTLEALASGVPVVAPDAGGAGELARRTGLLAPFRPADPAALARAVTETLDAASPELGARLRGFAESYSWSVSLGRMASFQARVVEAHRAGDLRPLEPVDRWHE